jgi:hypothetical protein
MHLAVSSAPVTVNHRAMELVNKVKILPVHTTSIFSVQEQAKQETSSGCIMLGLLFNSEVGGNIYIQNVGRLSLWEPQIQVNLGHICLIFFFLISPKLYHIFYSFNFHFQLE